MPSPQLAILVDMLRSAPPVPQDMDTAARRQRMEELTATAPLADGIRATGVDAGGVPSEWLEAAGASPRGTILYLHGGGAGVCISPWADLACTGESMKTRAARDPMVQRGPLLEMAAQYVGGQDPRAPLASPIYADLQGLPPLLIHVGTAETLLDDARRLADRARAAGVPVDIEVWDDMIHVWHAFAPLLPEADEAIARIGAWVRERLPA